MARVDADRNLLLGILAQQMDFVTRDALFAAMNAWIIRKETPLGVLLVERGDLAKSRRDLLEALVDEHVRAHGGDAARSLQALSSVGSVADDLSRLPDADVQASVGHLRTPEAVPPSGEPLETRVPESLGQPTSWNGRFRVVRPHASGGLGVVSVALDDELDREVAFKEIKDRYADDSGRRARFVLEAEITGKLEHPGIIPIYGLGHAPDGRPFYAMRFIRGDSLADAINRFHDPNGPFLDPTNRSLQLRELLGRFLDVCNALSYAHSRGVLHRDLKPGNVMLGPFGETLVVDWGLALPLERVPDGHESPHEAVKSTKANSASLPLEQGEVVGTPSYMPPEQAEGAIDRLGPRSDVYGLGAILYDLLTGKRPVEGTSLEEILHRVGQGEIKPPRQVRPEIPAALEAVCLKALALRPEDRYPNPRALAADIKAWLADEPVSARPEPIGERARRWAKRNRTAVTAAAAAMLVGLVGLGAVATVQTKANANLTVANVALDTQRRRAVDREAQAIDAVKRFGDVVSNNTALKNNPTLVSLRKELLKEPLSFFKKLRDQLETDRDTRPESLDRLAAIAFGLAYLTDEIGNKQDALRAYEESLAIRQRLAREHPAVTTFQRDLAKSYNNCGFLQRETGHPELAFASHARALEIFERLAREEPAVTEFQSGRAKIHNNIGILHRETGHPDQAIASYGRASEILERLAHEKPDVIEFQSELAKSTNNIGMLQSETGHPDRALTSYGRALAIRERLARENPTIIDFQHALATTFHNIAGLQEDTGQSNQALESYGRALEILERLARDNPAIIEFQSRLAMSQINFGNLQSAAGDPDQAIVTYGRALPIFERLARENPAVNEFQHALATSHNNIGIRQSEMGHPDLALESYGRALAIRERLARENPIITQFQNDLAASHINIGTLQSEMGHPDLALESYGLALASAERLVRENPESPDFAHILGLTLHNIARIDLIQKRYKEAKVKLEQAIVWEKKALTANPNHSVYREFLANQVTNLILALNGLNDPIAAAVAQRELDEFKASDPRYAALEAGLAAILRGEKQPRNNLERLQLAQRAYDKALHSAAAKLWADALDADPKLAEDRQAQHCYNAACAAALAGCGQGKDNPAPDDSTKAKLREQARGWLQAELAVWTKLLESGPAGARPIIVQTLKHWREDADLAGVRDPDALAKLTEVERKPWQTLWTEVDALIIKVGEAKAN